MTQSEKQMVGSNKGAFIEGVLHGSAAYEADILGGDILKSCDGKIVTNNESVSSIIKSSHGKTVKIILWRQGKEIEKTLFITEYN